MQKSSQKEEIKSNDVNNPFSSSTLLRYSVAAFILMFWAAFGFLGYCIGQYVSNHVNEPFFDFLPAFIKSFF